MDLSSEVLTGMEMSWTIVRASASARLKACIMTTGWMLRSSCGRACAKISPAAGSQTKVCEYQRDNIPSIITVVVPSPTSSSCVLLNSIMLFAAGCATSISRRMAWPSFVRTMPPIGSSSILSIAFGPRHDRMISATLHVVSFAAGELWNGLPYVFAAVMFEICAFRPTCLSPFCVLTTITGACIVEVVGGSAASVLWRYGS